MCLRVHTQNSAIRPQLSASLSFLCRPLLRAFNIEVAKYAVPVQRRPSRPNLTMSVIIIMITIMIFIIITITLTLTLTVTVTVTVTSTSTSTITITITITTTTTITITITIIIYTVRASEHSVLQPGWARGLPVGWAFSGFGV